ncbi:MAG: hypothetical protein HYS02_00205 [Candidatus Staskawiczbacteria bacterium]|nr:hypothetical protein [Candidatus Staskawiczbacteria bacterium]
MDILISIAIISIVFITIVSIGTMSLNISSLITNTNQADSLIKEEIESLRSFRDGTDWFVNGLGTVNKGINNPYHIFLDTSSNPNKWNLAQGTETTGIFTRQIVFDNVSRDPATNNIEDNYNQSHNDPDTIKVTVTVAWPNKTSKVIMYLTNWHE